MFSVRKMNLNRARRIILQTHTRNSGATTDDCDVTTNRFDRNLMAHEIRIKFESATNSDFIFN